MDIKYVVYAANGKVAAKFSTYGAANEFTMLNGGTIVTVGQNDGPATEKQKRAVLWTAHMLGEEIRGIEHATFMWCHRYLNKYMKLALEEQQRRDIEMLENSDIIDKDYYG